MPPHAETTMEIEEMPEAPKKNLTVAFNYEVSLVDEFVSSTRKQRRSSTTVEPVPGATVEDSNIHPPTISEPELKRKDSNVENNVEAANKRRSLLLSAESIRRSNRDRQGKRDVSYARTQVRYDMQQVPFVRKNKAFLQAFPRWWMIQNNDKQSAATRRSSRLASPLDGAELSCCPERMEDIMPFEDESSLIWIPSKRSEWEDSVSEMTAVCTSAGLHRYYAKNNTQKPFQAPLSRDYIRDRVDIDDPLNGFQIRHKDGGWLQGFLLWTNFTTWTHCFKWDSVHEQSGVRATVASRRADRDGSLATELEACSRSGDPLVGGIVFPEIAEIALVGGLGCGEYLLRMALDGIRAAKKYKFVVLQATDESKSFYERYGFVRVGAICRYSSNISSTENPVVGYRHWTHPNESDASLQLHGGPSYMMCLKLPTECSACGRADCDVAAENSFLETVIRMTTADEKPTVGQLGATSLSFWKSSNSSVGSGQSAGTAPKRRPGRPSLKSSPVRNKGTIQLPEANGPLPPPPVAKRRFSIRPPTEPSPKRRKSEMAGVPSDVVLPAPGGASQGIIQGFSPPVQVAPKKPRGRPRKLTKKSTTSKKPPKPGDKKERLYHSVRGPDGRFIRVPIDGFEAYEPTAKTAASKPSHSAASIPKAAPKPKPKAANQRSSPKRVNRAELKKQKVKAYPRDRIHFYNRVVKPKNGKKDYFFVLNYNEGKETIQIVPMHANGVCHGTHAGQPRYQCVVGDTDENFRTEHIGGFQLVPATMIMKTSIVAQEAWVIED